MQWIKEVELVDSVDELRSSSSTRGISMPNFEVLDARIASALNKIIHNSQFKRRISLEEQQVQKEDRFLRGRQIAYLIFEQFRVTGTDDSVENYTDLFTIAPTVISPVPVSISVDDRSGQPDDETQANKIPKTNKKETPIERGNPLCSDDPEIPEWLQEFRENLVDDEIPLQGCSHASSSHEASSEPITKRREDLGKHNIHTHFPKDRNCEICKRTKITRVPYRRRKGEAVPRADNFGDLITADHKVLSDNCESRNNHRYAVVVQDLATQWIQAYPCKNKTSQETQRSLQKFLEPERKPKVIYTDNSLEFGKACEDLSWNHCTSTPHRSETNGIAERAVRRVKEGTSAVLLQSGLNESWWAVSMECYTYLRNVTDLLSDGKTPHERRFGQPFKGLIIPFGSLVEYHPITAKDQSRIHQFGKKVLPGLFLGYALYAGRIWKGDVLIADLEELETMDASEI